VRDPGGLESAVARPENLLVYGRVGSVAELGVALAWAILRNHPFTDGNKQAALAALTLFIELNESRLTCSEVEETAMVLRAAGSEMSEEEWTAWVLRSVEPLPG